MTAQALQRAGDGHGHERNAADRHAQGRDGPELLAGAADRDPDLARRLVAHPAGAGRPARHGQRRRATRAPTSAAPTSSRRARATSPTRSTARRSRTTRTATRSRARTAARTRSSTSRPSRTSRSRRAARSSSSRTRASRSTSSPSAAPTSSRARPATSTPRTTGSRTTRPQEAVEQGLPTNNTRIHPRVRRRPRRPDRQGQALALVRRRVPDIST